jgi:hypothetical protein
MVAPLAYIYILLMLLRDLCSYFPESIHEPLQTYVPFLARWADAMNNSSRLMDMWCVIEALFFIACKMKIQYLQRKDPLEASLSAAPMLDPDVRKLLWDRMMEVEQDDPGALISGWFFDRPIEEISRYDVYDFICWSMFDGRNQEHLTTEELHDLECFLEDLEYRISFQVHGARQEKDASENDKENDTETRKSNALRERPVLQNLNQSYEEDDTLSSKSDFSSSTAQRRLLPRPKKSKFCPGNEAVPWLFFSLVSYNTTWLFQCFAFQSTPIKSNQDYFPTCTNLINIGMSSIET